MRAWQQVAARAPSPMCPALAGHLLISCPRTVVGKRLSGSCCSRTSNTATSALPRPSSHRTQARLTTLSHISGLAPLCVQGPCGRHVLFRVPGGQLTGDTHALLIFIRNWLRSSFVGLSKAPGHLWSPLRTDPRGQPREEAEESAQLQAA